MRTSPSDFRSDYLASLYAAVPDANTGHWQKPGIGSYSATDWDIPELLSLTPQTAEAWQALGAEVSRVVMQMDQSAAREIANVVGWMRRHTGENHRDAAWEIFKLLDARSHGWIGGELITGKGSTGGDWLAERG